MADIVKMYIPKEDYGIYKLPEVLVEAVSPEITREAARRFVLQVLPYSLLNGNDYRRNVLIPGWIDNTKEKRALAVQDSINAREARGDYQDAALAKKELNHLNLYGTAGCLGSVTYNYGEMLGPRFHYDNNGVLYRDTKNGKSPYTFIIEDLPTETLVENTPERQTLLDRFQVGDIISGMNTDPGEEYRSLSGHAKMITGIKRDNAGHVTEILYTQDLCGSPNPGSIVTKTWVVNSPEDLINENPFSDHLYNNLYRIKTDEVKKLLKRKFGGNLNRIKYF